MTEFKNILISQLIAILFLVGLALGSTIQQTRVVQLPALKLPSQDYVLARAKRIKGTYVAYYKNGNWFYENEKGQTCRLFTKEVERWRNQH
ncbi:MAG TPA: hypothetical protein ACFYD4_14565 [Candidatus Wunengus sp. YC61]|uniref:hypothetical protein n=1 Tax=Candidatus Wunengus sp. YC61 TaxID=3367698 RepID=UPI0040259A53